MTDESENLAARLRMMRGAAGITDWETYDEDLADAFLCALAVAYDAGRLVVDEGWRPIETAPKDGRVVLGYWAEDRVETIQFKSGNFVYSYDWEDECDGPTHWRPLPAPPKGEGE